MTKPEPRPKEDPDKTVPLKPEGKGSSQPRPVEDTNLFSTEFEFSQIDPLTGNPFQIPVDLIGHPRYEILEYVGSGGMGVVYKAQHRFMDRLVAVKIVHQSFLDRPVMIERFRCEVKAAARLSQYRGGL